MEMYAETNLMSSMYNYCKTNLVHCGVLKLQFNSFYRQQSALRSDKTLEHLQDIAKGRD